jgi:drug/metabolite transporter (DMT)-like permease
MTPRSLVELVVLAALWGASFLFMRVAAPELGPLPLAALRVGIATAVLLPFLLARGGLGDLRGRGRQMLVVGFLNSGLPFALFSYAALSLTAGLSAILNATSPLWGGLVAHLWLKDRLTPSRVLGLAVGFGGVGFLVWGRASFAPGGGGLAVAAVLTATLSYGLAARYAKKHLGGLNALASSFGSLAASTLMLAPLAALSWPAGPVSTRAWAAVVVFATLCTAFAYIIYFRLIAAVGPARAIAVTFLIPAFAILWGALFLGEALTGRMLAGALIVVAGTALATGVVKLPGAAKGAARSA